MCTIKVSLLIVFLYILLLHCSIIYLNSTKVSNITKLHCGNLFELILTTSNNNNPNSGTWYNTKIKEYIQNLELNLATIDWKISNLYNPTRCQDLEKYVKIDIQDMIIHEHFQPRIYK